MTQHNHQLPEELENNKEWTAWLEIIKIRSRYATNPQIEVQILLRDEETGIVSPSEQLLLEEGDTITIAPWKDEKQAPRPQPSPAYFWLQGKGTGKRYISKFQYSYDEEAYKIHIPAHPLHKNWVADPAFYSGFYILDIPATLEEYEEASDEH